MNDILTLSSLVFMSLVLWLDTEVIVEWGRIFGLGGWFRLDEYDSQRLRIHINFPTFVAINVKHGRFLFKLLACPACLGFWASALMCLTFERLGLFPIVFSLSLLSYTVFKRIKV